MSLVLGSISYQPRRLARLRLWTGGDLERAASPEIVPEAWREGTGRPQDGWATVPESAVHERLFGNGAGLAGFVLVTGEPGSGKSTLLEAWLERWAEAKPSPVLGARVPVLVKLRELPRDEIGAIRIEGDPEAAADRLWRLKYPPHRKLADAVRPFHGRESGRLWHPIWLLDGLDELPTDLLDERLLRCLANLPGRACVSCRTAVAQSLARALDACVADDEAFELLPLTMEEQGALLAAWLDGDRARADRILARLRSSTQLAAIAGNPLLLELIAAVGDQWELPDSRHEFYERAVASLWSRRVPPSDADRFLEDRDRVLATLAGKVELRQISFSLKLLSEALGPRPEPERAALRSALRDSGLLDISQGTERCQFMHLTFQEYYLALHYGRRPLSETLMRHWSDPRYDETLALLIARAFSTDRKAEADQALRDLIAFGVDNRRTKLGEWHKLGRSPFLATLHLVSRAAIDLSECEQTLCLFRNLIEPSFELKLVVALDDRSPPHLLRILHTNNDPFIRRLIAMNPSTPSECRAALAQDQDPDVQIFARSYGSDGQVDLSVAMRARFHLISADYAIFPSVMPEHWIDNTRRP